MHTVSKSDQMTGDDIHFRLKNNSDLNWKLRIYENFRDLKGFRRMKFQKIKQQSAKITYDKTKQRVINPT